MAIEDYAAVFAALRFALPSIGVLERLVVSAFELQTLEAYETVRSAYALLPLADREALRSTRSRRVILDAVLQGEVPETDLKRSEHLPQNWLDWARGLLDQPQRKGWYKVAERGAFEWSLSQFIEEQDHISELNKAILLLQNNQQLQFALPHLVHSLQAASDGLPDHLNSLLQTIMGILALNKECSASDLKLWGDLTDSVLQMGTSPKSYLEIVEQAIFLWQTYQAPDLIDWALNVLDSLAVHPCRDAQARSSFLSAAFGGFTAFPQRLTEVQFKFFEQLCKECGQPTLSESLKQEPTKLPESSELYSKLKKKTVAIYTLTEKAGERLQTLLEEWFDGVRVTLSHDKVGNPSLRKMAENADIFLISTGSAKHAATTFIQEHRSQEKTTILVSTKGTTGMLNALLAHLEARD